MLLEGDLLRLEGELEADLFLALSDSRSLLVLGECFLWLTDRLCSLTGLSLGPGPLKITIKKFYDIKRTFLNFSGQLWHSHRV
jgi:hypothetical protein